MSDEARLSPLSPALPKNARDHLRWTRLHGSSRGLAVSRAAESYPGLVLTVVPDTPSAVRLEEEIHFYLGRDPAFPILHFPDWETLPYDTFSPHQDIISERLATLYQLLTIEKGLLVVPVSTLMVRIPPPEYLSSHSLILHHGDHLDLPAMRARLDSAGYRCVGQVMEHGEFAVRGSLLDLYPMGSALPFRIDLLDDEVDSIRTFDPETQRTLQKVSDIHLLPAREFPVTEEGINRFRRNWRARFEGDPTACPLYRDVSQGLAPAGIEYYLPLFFEETTTLLDVLPETSLAIIDEAVHEGAGQFWHDLRDRYEQRRYDRERPVLPPGEIFLQENEVFQALGRFRRITLGQFSGTESKGRHEYATRVPTHLPVDGRAADPLGVIKAFINGFNGRILFVAESAGRREALLDTLREQGIQPLPFASWAGFLEAEAPLGITASPLESGALLDIPAIAVITEFQLFGERAMQRRRRKPTARDAETIVRDLTELSIGAPVVHEDHGVGRYQGLERLTVGGTQGEFLTLEYAGGDRLYVPVSSLHLITRYTGAESEQAPLHRLGNQQWQKAKKKAAMRARDVAAELLEIQARRAARPGNPVSANELQQLSFAAAFPFEETPDQLVAIQDTLADLASPKPMDRLICGDVGFGKTEVAMRAAHAAVDAGWQVAVLVPTTLLAQQHHQNFRDRFADWPIRVEQLSRFRTRPQQDAVLADLANGRVDIVIGTHKLLQSGVNFKRLGLVIIDEEHRFGVRQKESLKALRAEVDVLTLTATPIPRTLNMALSGMRDMSLIATPPERRLSIKTFVTHWEDNLIREACLREIRRGGQVYFIHNKVADIETTAERVKRLVPEATVQVAHGQMRETLLERAMLDFYHRRFNILVCTTIIETGIDVPNANTIIINRADRFGLAQLHQLRGRVGRSHHRAYAFLLAPPRAAMSADAVKRLEAIESLEDLGIGFSLATHDLEIRGAGELLGEEQSGQIQEIGYALYTEFLQRAVDALKAGRSPELDRPLDHGAEMDLHVTALIPDDYLPDIHTRLIMYKRIAGASDPDALRALQVEMIDRFGLLPDALKNLFRITELKLKATPLGIRKIDFGPGGGRILFAENPEVDPSSIVGLIQNEPKTYALVGGDKLRINANIPDEEKRMQALESLLVTLSIRDAA